MSKKISMGKSKRVLKPIGQHLVTWSPEISPDTATPFHETSKISASPQTWGSVLARTNSSLSQFAPLKISKIFPHKISKPTKGAQAIIETNRFTFTASRTSKKTIH